MPDHVRIGRCGHGSFLCANPEHWKWDAINHGQKWFMQVRSGYPHLFVYGPEGDREAKQFLIDDAIGGHSKIAYKALGILAWKREDYAEWKPTIIAMYPSIVGK